ncbi:MAG TPA: Sua5/YciO/YrdC/YwlC family protein, partial [Phycisphaerales bacterium]|nr:Sua5/YciO/YrdC/YwlC family protein [Phycisphaerales bacterium]
MKTSRTIRAASSDRQRSEQVRLLGDALRDGGLVVLPTETVYGVAASAVDPRARLRLDRLVEAAGGEIASSHASRHTLHAPDADRLVQDLDITHPIHRRLFRRLAPGPVRFAVEKQAQDLIACLDRLGVGEGIIDEGRFVYARVPNHELCREVLRAAEVPVVIRRLSVFGWGSGRDIGAVSDDEVAEQSGLAWVLDDGVTSLGGHSTTVQLRLAGGFAVEPGGAL